MAELTAFERAELVIEGDRGELTVAAGEVTIRKEAPTRQRPTTVTVPVDRVRGTQLRTAGRGGRGWLHVAVVGGSPAPPGELAAVGDPYTLPLTSRSVGAARRFAKMVERHVQERGLPREAGPSDGRISSGVTVTGRSAVPPAPPPPPPPAASPPAASPPALAEGATDLVAELETLAGLRDRGILTEEEFERAKARVLG